MTDPRGTITPAQHEILRAVWQAGEAGATVAQVWRTISMTRKVSRTTILNLVDRLEKRGWLKRSESDGPCRYRPALDHDETSARLAGEFVDGFFGGSATNMVSSLLGSERIAVEDVKRLRAILAEAERHNTRNKNGGAR